MILAHQYLDQLATDLRGAVLNTAGTVSCFRLGYQDATVMAHELFPPNYLRETHLEFDVTRIAGHRLPMLQEHSEALKHAALVNQLTQLRAREFWTKRRGPHAPVKQRALTVPESVGRDLYAVRQRLVELSGQRFGRLKNDVRKELANGRSSAPYESTTYYEPV